MGERADHGCREHHREAQGERYPCSGSVASRVSSWVAIGPPSLHRLRSVCCGLCGCVRPAASYCTRRNIPTRFHIVPFHTCCWHTDGQNLPFTKVVHKVVTVDAQPSSPTIASLVVLVTGQLIVDDGSNILQFSQMFQVSGQSLATSRPAIARGSMRIGAMALTHSSSPTAAAITSRTMSSVCECHLALPLARSFTDHSVYG